MDNSNKMKKTNKSEKTVSRDMRDAFGETLVELGNAHSEMVFLDVDLHTSTKATLFKDRFPDRFYQVGIAEQNLFGIAAGLAREGFMPFPSTFAAFAARRAGLLPNCALFRSRAVSRGSGV